MSDWYDAALVKVLAIVPQEVGDGDTKLSKILFELDPKKIANWSRHQKSVYCYSYQLLEKLGQDKFLELGMIHKTKPSTLVTWFYNVNPTTLVDDYTTWRPRIGELYREFLKREGQTNKVHYRLSFDLHAI